MNPKWPSVGRSLHLRTEDKGMKQPPLQGVVRVPLAGLPCGQFPWELLVVLRKKGGPGPGPLALGTRPSSQAGNGLPVNIIWPRAPF